MDGGSIPEGTLKLIIRTYIEDLVASTDVIDEIIKVKLLSLRWAAFSASRSETLFPGPSPFQTNKQTVLPNSDHIVSHPALHQNHFHVGSEPPTAEPASNHRLNEVGVCAFPERLARYARYARYASQLKPPKTFRFPKQASKKSNNMLVKRQHPNLSEEQQGKTDEQASVPDNFPSDEICKFVPRRPAK